MYEELVELLRMRAALIDSDLDNQAVEAIEILEALAQNGQSAIDTNKRLADKIRMLKAKLDQAKEALDFCRTKDAEIIRLGQECSRLKRERDQAVEELHRNTDAVPVVRCKDCKSYKKSGEYEDENGEIKEYWYCEFHSLPKNLVQMQSDDFCSYGERKEN